VYAGGEGADPACGTSDRVGPGAWAGTGSERGRNGAGAPGGAGPSPREVGCRKRTLALELTDIVYTSGPPSEGGTDDRTRTRSECCTPAGDHPPRPGGDGQRLQDL